MSTSASAEHCRGRSNDCMVMFPLKRVVLISPPHFFCNKRHAARRCDAHECHHEAMIPEGA